MWGPGEADLVRWEGAQVYVGDHVHRASRVRSRPASTASRWSPVLHPRAAAGAAGTHRPCSNGLTEVSRPGSRGHLLETPDWGALETDWHGRRSVMVAFSRRRRQRVPPRRGGGAVGANFVAAATGVLGLAARCPSASQRLAFAREPRGARCTRPGSGQGRVAWIANAGYRCYSASAGFLTCGPAARRRGLAEFASGTNADERRGPARPPPRRARRGRPAAGRRAQQGAGPRRLAALGPADLGQARGGLSVSRSPTAWRSAPRLARVERAGRAPASQTPRRHEPGRGRPRPRRPAGRRGAVRGARRPVRRCGGRPPGSFGAMNEPWTTRTAPIKACVGPPARRTYDGAPPGTRGTPPRCEEVMLCPPERSSGTTPRRASASSP